MEVKFTRGRRGDMIAHVNGKVAFPLHGGPVPKEGEWWVVSVVQDRERSCVVRLHQRAEDELRWNAETGRVERRMVGTAYWYDDGGSTPAAVALLATKEREAGDQFTWSPWKLNGGYDSRGLMKVREGRATNGYRRKASEVVWPTCMPGHKDVAGLIAAGWEVVNVNDTLHSLRLRLPGVEGEVAIWLDRPKIQPTKVVEVKETSLDMVGLVPGTQLPVAYYLRFQELTPAVRALLTPEQTELLRQATEEGSLRETRERAAQMREYLLPLIERLKIREAMLAAIAAGEQVSCRHESYEGAEYESPDGMRMTSDTYHSTVVVVGGYQAQYPGHFSSAQEVVKRLSTAESGWWVLKYGEENKTP